MRLNNWLSRMVDWVLGADESPNPNPDRLRRNYLVSFLLIVSPIIGISLFLDYFRDYDAFFFSRMSAFFSVSLCLLFLKLDKYSLAIDVLFFGGSLSISLIMPLSYYFAWELGEYQGLVPLALFAAVALNGLYSASLTRITLLFALSLVYDLFYFLMPETDDFIGIYSQFGIMVLHTIAYGIGRFLIVYFDRLSRIAEARRVMNRRLEELMAENRIAGTARLETLSHDFRSPLTALMGVQTLLSKTTLDEDQRHYLEILEKSNRLLLDLVESILE